MRMHCGARGLRVYMCGRNKSKALDCPSTALAAALALAHTVEGPDKFTFRSTESPCAIGARLVFPGLPGVRPFLVALRVRIHRAPALTVLSSLGGHFRPDLVSHGSTGFSDLNQRG